MTDVDKRIQNTKEAFLKALEMNLGIITPACQATNISRQTFYRWRKEDPEFRDKCDEIKELQKDLAESAILKQIRDGNTSMIIFYAKTQMRDRGYIERVENVNRNVDTFDDESEEDLRQELEKLRNEQNKVKSE